MDANKPVRAALGMRLTIELLDASGNSEAMEVILVPDRSADFSRGLLGESTPLGRTLLDQPVGAILAYPVGDLKAVRLLVANPVDDRIIEAAAEHRQQEVEKTMREIAQKNAATFAASFSGKWGDYDPDGVAHWEGDQE